MPSCTITNAMTIDVEDYFQVSAFAPHIPRSEWNERECRVEKNVHLILEMLSQAQTKATFFTLGWIADRYPGLIREVISEGHELASHGYAHERASEQSPAAFLADIHLAKIVLEDISGVAVNGYRAPSFSIGEGNLWAFDCLVKAGYKYSSSVYPIRHDHYGMSNSPRFVHEVRPGFLEIPLTTWRLMRRNIPSSGGGYFRLMPYSFSRWMLGRVNNKCEEAAVFYFHPWEIDPDQPRIEGVSRKTKFRHYVNIDRMQARLSALLTDFKWDRMDRVFMPQLALTSQQTEK
jgi:polysaccharide deacetylase family protein (PEP-CTERM system associated)